MTVFVTLLFAAIIGAASGAVASVCMIAAFHAKDRNAELLPIVFGEVKEDGE